MGTVLLTHPDCVLHEMGAGHPESPQRLESILAALEASGLGARLAKREAPEATREQLERVHELALKGCPGISTLRDPVAVDSSLSTQEAAWLG